LFFLLSSCTFALTFWINAQNEFDGASLLSILLSVVLPLGGAFWTFYVFNTTIELSDETITLINVFETKNLPLSGIKGRREYVERGSKSRNRHLQLIPNDDRLPMLDFLKCYDFDEDFYCWFNQLPDLDKEDEKRKKDSNFGLI